MGNKLLKIATSLGLVLSGILLLPTGVYAQNPTPRPNSFLPPAIQEIFGLLGDEGEDTASFVTARVRTGLYIALGLIVLVAVVYSLIAAFKYIQSQGDPGKIEEAQKAIKAIFFGIAAMFIAIVGIVLVFVFFNFSPPDATLGQACISDSNSLGCQACQSNDRELCDTCNLYFQDPAANAGDAAICE